MTVPELTIVVPVYNREKVVVNTLRSIAAQKLRPLAVILVDNASTDGTRKVLEQWQHEMQSADFQIKVIDCNTPGACAARNAGLELVASEWTMFFDSDDEMLPNHCQRALNCAEEADVVGWDIMTYNTDGSPIRKLPFIKRDALYSNIMLSSFSTQRYMARTALFRKAGGWLENAKVYDDVELGVRLLKLSPRLVYAGPEITVNMITSPNSIMTADADRLSRIEIGLNAIEDSLPPKKKHWVDLQRLLKAADWGKGDPNAPALAAKVIARQPFLRRQLWKLFYIYSQHGGRGVARLYRPFDLLGI